MQKVYVQSISQLMSSVNRLNILRAETNVHRLPALRSDIRGMLKHQVATRKMVSVENEIVKKRPTKNSEIIAKEF